MSRPLRSAPRALLLSVAVAGCSAATPALPRPAGSIRAVALVDSIALASDLPRRRFLFRVAVRFPSSTDTLPGVFTDHVPTLVGDSLVFGATYDSSGAHYRWFRYSARAPRVDTFAPPADFAPNLTTVALAPDGRHLAYVRFPGDNTGIGVVRRWPGGEAVMETQVVRVAAGDVLGGAATWRDATHVEIVIESQGGSGWLRFRGDTRRAGWTVDTLGAGLPAH